MTAATVVATFSDDFFPWLLSPVEVGLGEVDDGEFEPVRVSSLEPVEIDVGNLEVEPMGAGGEIEEFPDISG